MYDNRMNRDYSSRIIEHRAGRAGRAGGLRQSSQPILFTHPGQTPKDWRRPAARNRRSQQGRVFEVERDGRVVFG